MILIKLIKPGPINIENPVVAAKKFGVSDHMALATRNLVLQFTSILKCQEPVLYFENTKHPRLTKGRLDEFDITFNPRKFSLDSIFKFNLVNLDC
jgi:hypothetical protein